MPGPSRGLEAGQQDELVGTAACVAGGVSAVWRNRGEFASIIMERLFMTKHLFLLAIQMF